MAGLVNYNPYSDAGSSLGGAGDMLGSVILRSAMMRQQAQQQQQQLMLEVMRLRQEAENARSLKEYRGEEIGLRKKEGEREDVKLGFAKQKAEEGAGEMAMRRRFATSMRGQGVPQPPGGVGPPSPEEERQADAQESAAFLSNEPKNALDTVLRMQALRELGGKLGPVLSQEMLTGMPLHNVPMGNVAVPPGGGEPAATGLPRPAVGADASVNSIANLLARRFATAPSIGEAMKDPDTALMNQFIMQAVRKGMGTNAPAAQGKIVIQNGNRFQVNPDGSSVYLGPAQ